VSQDCQSIDVLALERIELRIESQADRITRLSLIDD